MPNKVGVEQKSHQQGVPVVDRHTGFGSPAQLRSVILALGAFPAAGEDSIVVSKRVASDLAVRWGIMSSTRRTLPACRMLCLQQYRSR
jgi:hypothetical protein